MNYNPSVSVIVTTYNRKELLRETIDSILCQTFNDFELIIVDNFSNYNIFEYIKSFRDSRIRVFQNNNNGIIAVNRNYGIKKAKGKYVAFCDDDDLWTKEKLTEQINAMTKQHVNMVYSICELFGSTSFFSNMYGIYPIPYRVKPTKENLLINNTIALSTVIIRRNILDQVGGFDTSESFFGVEDYELWLRISETTSIMFIPRIHTYYRIHPNMTQLQSSKSKIGLKEIHKKHGGSYKYTKFDKERNIVVILIRSIFYFTFQILINLHLFELKLFRKNFIKL